MQRDELRQLVQWAEAEGWNPGLHDANLFWELDPEGYLAMLDDGQLVGGGAIIRHSEDFGFMGLFIVKPSHRGKKLGEQLWFARRDHLLTRLRPGGTIALDGVDPMVPFYAAGGFRASTRHRRFELPSGVLLGPPNRDVVALDEIPMATIVQYDAACFPCERERYLELWINQADAITLAIPNGSQLAGYGVMRPCVTGWKIGPLFADSEAIAKSLVQEFRKQEAAGPIYLDAPNNNPAAIGLCGALGMDEVFGCERMYFGPAPKIDHLRIFGTTTLEVG